MKLHLVRKIINLMQVKQQLINPRVISDSITRNQSENSESNNGSQANQSENSEQEEGLGKGFFFTF